MTDALNQFLGKRSEIASEYREKIEEMLNDEGRYRFAETTLLGILDYINKKDTITDGQIKAVENIKNSV